MIFEMEFLECELMVRNLKDKQENYSKNSVEVCQVKIEINNLMSRKWVQGIQIKNYTCFIWRWVKCNISELREI